MKIEYKDRKQEGSCNFCRSKDYTKVTMITGVGHGPQLSVRFCDSCIDKVRNFKNPKKEKFDGKYQIFYKGKDTGLTSNKREASLNEVQKVVKEKIEPHEFVLEIEFKPIK